MAELIKTGEDVVGVKTIDGREVYFRDRIKGSLVTKIIKERRSIYGIDIPIVDYYGISVQTTDGSNYQIDVDILSDYNHQPRFTWVNKLDKQEEAWLGDEVFYVIELGDRFFTRTPLAKDIKLDFLFTQKSDAELFLSKSDNLETTTKVVKPPLGLTPRQIHTEQRIDEIGEAILRTISHFEFFKIPLEWIAELEDLYIQLNQPIYSIDPDLRRKIEHREAINFTFNRRTAVCIILYIFRFRRQGEYNDVKYIKHQILSQIRTDEESLSQNQTHD